MLTIGKQLTPEQQSMFIVIWNNFCNKMGFIPVFPVHGGTLGQIGKCVVRLSYGKYNKYDALAPEFNTYPVIKAILTGKLQIKSITSNKPIKVRL